MRETWARAFADGREAALMGGDAARLLDASARLSLAGSRSASCFVEAPLLGAPAYDALVIHNPRSLFPGRRIADPTQVQAQAVLDWAAGTRGGSGPSYGSTSMRTLWRMLEQAIIADRQVLLTENGLEGRAHHGQILPDARCHAGVLSVIGG